MNIAFTIRCHFLFSVVCNIIIISTFSVMLSVLETARVRWPNAPNFCLGPPEISKLWTLVAQIYLSGNGKMDGIFS